MFSLFSGLWSYLFTPPTVHILILGIDHAGKTTFLEKTKAIFAKNIPHINPDQIRPTIGMNLAKLTWSGSPVVMWDLGGQVKMRSLWEKYYDEADTIAFVLDSADLDRIDEARRAFEIAYENEMLSNIPFVIIANKQDVAGALRTDEIRERFIQRHIHDINVQQGSSSKKNRSNIEIFPISALSGDGMQQSVESIITIGKYRAKNR